MGVWVIIFFFVGLFRVIWGKNVVLLRSCCFLIILIVVLIFFVVKGFRGWFLVFEIWFNLINELFIWVNELVNKIGFLLFFKIFSFIV